MILALVGVLAGCGAETAPPGATTAATTAPGTTTAPATAAGTTTASATAPGTRTAPATRPDLTVPKVAAPLDPGPRSADPCALVPETTRTAIGLPAAMRTDVSGQTACDLAADTSTPKPLRFLRIQVIAGRGLADYTAQCGSANCDTWSMGEVDGYPVIRANGELESRYGSCKLFLGVSDTATVLVNDARTEQATAPDCGRAETVAAAVITTLRG